MTDDEAIWLPASVRAPREVAARYHREDWWRSTTFLDDLAARRRETPSGLAIRVQRAHGGSDSLTWSEYADRVERYAAALRALGAGPGRVVALQLPTLLSGLWDQYAETATAPITLVITAGTTVPPQIVVQARDVTGVSPRTLYGMTENPIITFTRAGDPADWGEHSDGRVNLGTEPALLKHPGVADVALIGVQVEHDTLDQAVAVIVPAEGATPTLDELREFLTELGMTDWYLPTHILIVDVLPRNTTGKVLKERLRDDPRVKATVSMNSK